MNIKYIFHIEIVHVTSESFDVLLFNYINLLISGIYNMSDQGHRGQGNPSLLVLLVRNEQYADCSYIGWAQSVV